MVAIILCAGKGDRLKEFKFKNKCLIPCFKYTLLAHKIKLLEKIDYIEKIIIVVGYNSAFVINEVVKQKHKEKIQFINQNPTKGIVDALKIAHNSVFSKSFILLLGDEYMHNPDYYGMMKFYKKSKALITVGCSITTDLSKIKKTYSINFLNNLVCELIEKPQKIINNYIGTGVIIFNREVLDNIPYIPINSCRGERDLVDLINFSISQNKKINLYKITEKYININDKNDLNELYKYIKVNGKVV